MAFIQVKLTKSINQSRGIFDKYIYKPDNSDSIATVLGSGYFDDSRYISDPDWIGSIIEISASNGYAIARIVDGGLIVLYDSTGGGSMNVEWGAITGDINSQADLAEVAKTNDYDDLINKFNPTTDIIIERLIDGVSLATSQEPSTTGFADAINVEFGAAQGTGSDPVELDVNGRATFNEAGLYRIKVVFQFGRTGGAGTSEVLFRFLVDGVQLGRTVGVKLGNADDLRYIDIDNWFNVPVGAVLDTQVMRDDAGNDSGGLFKTIPTDEGVGTWNDVPCAVLRIERWIPAP